MFKLTDIEIEEEVKEEVNTEDIPEDNEEASEGTENTETENTETENTETEEPVTEEETGEEKQEVKEEDGEENKEAGKEENKDKKKVFKKKKDKRDEQIEALTDQVKRQMAEFDNFRKRTEKEKSSMYEMGAKSVVEKILPVIDNFERGLDTVPEDEKDSPFTEGMRMIYKQLMTELDNIGVKPIEALGQEFNPDFHNAVMQVESEEYESGHVAQELQKGYMYRDSVVRHSMVAVVS
ncbi:MAG: nucleotide exchange factor GrpE [Lachnospiraceae bacterium]|nr:nucleotide exchange factor GrpE [Lachnospiraceae bacterium]